MLAELGSCLLFFFFSTVFFFPKWCLQLILPCIHASVYALRTDLAVRISMTNGKEIVLNFKVWVVKERGKERRPHLHEELILKNSTLTGNK